MIAYIVLLMVLPSFMCERMILLDLTPEEAQKYIASRSLDLNFAKQIDESTLSEAKDAATRKFYNKGKLIDNPDEYIERTYQANQFHGQDGLGRSMFGYSDWNQGRLEARNANGEVRGSYQYVDPYGENIVVNYWSDSLGFHQMDNRPKFVMEPMTETPEVQAARAAHEKAWAAAAKAALENPDPMSDIYNANANKIDEEQSELNQAMEIIAGVSNQQQSLTRYPNLPYDQHIKPDAKGAASDDSVVIEAFPLRGKRQFAKIRIEENDKAPIKHAAKSIESRGKRQFAKIRIEENEKVEEKPSEPRGFFYNFDYPVQLIVPTVEERSAKVEPKRMGKQVADVEQNGAELSSEPKTKRTGKQADLDSMNTKLEAEVADYKIVKRSMIETDNIQLESVANVQELPEQKVKFEAPEISSEKSKIVELDTKKPEDIETKIAEDKLLETKPEKRTELEAEIVPEIKSETKSSETPTETKAETKAAESPAVKIEEKSLAKEIDETKLSEESPIKAETDVKSSDKIESESKSSNEKQATEEKPELKVLLKEADIKLEAEKDSIKSDEKVEVKAIIGDKTESDLKSETEKDSTKVEETPELKALLSDKIETDTKCTAGKDTHLKVEEKTDTKSDSELVKSIHTQHIIPVEVKIESTPEIEKDAESIVKSTPSEIVSTVAELKRLATNEDLIDAVHDAQINPKQSLRP